MELVLFFLRYSRKNSAFSSSKKLGPPECSFYRAKHRLWLPIIFIHKVSSQTTCTGGSNKLGREANQRLSHLKGLTRLAQILSFYLSAKKDRIGLKSVRKRLLKCIEDFACVRTVLMEGESTPPLCPFAIAFSNSIKPVNEYRKNITFQELREFPRTWYSAKKDSLRKLSSPILQGSFNLPNEVYWNSLTYTAKQASPSSQNP